MADSLLPIESGDHYESRSDAYHHYAKRLDEFATEVNGWWDDSYAFGHTTAQAMYMLSMTDQNRLVTLVAKMCKAAQVLDDLATKGRPDESRR
jgi:hypothetical protein